MAVPSVLAMWWALLANDGAVCVGFELAGDADVGAYAHSDSIAPSHTEGPRDAKSA